VKTLAVVVKMMA